MAAIDPRLAEAKDESTHLRPMTIIDTENATIPTTGAVIATPVAPKKRNAEALRPRKKSEAGVIASLRVVTIRPRHDGIVIAIATTTNLRILPRERSKNKKTTLLNSLKQLPVAEITAIIRVIKMLPKKICRSHHLRRIDEKNSKKQTEEK